MKLYATITSERDSRPAKKGGNDYIRIELTDRNNDVAIIVLQARDQGLAGATVLRGTTVPKR